MKHTNLHSNILSTALCLLMIALLSGCTTAETTPLATGQAETSASAQDEMVVVTPTLIATALAPTASVESALDAAEPTVEPIAVEIEQAPAASTEADEVAAAAQQIEDDMNTAAQSSPLAGLSRVLLLSAFVENDVLTKPLAATELSLAVDGSSVSGSAGCNSYSGELVLDGSSVSIGRLASTRKACVPEVMEQEARFLLALESAENLSVQDGNLVLEHAQGELFFTPWAAAAAAAEASLETADDPAEESDFVDSDNDGVSDDNVPAPVERTAYELAPVDSFDISISDGTPTEATITIRGAFSNGCGEIIGKEQDLLDDGTINFLLKAQASDPAVVCAAVMTPFEVSYPFFIDTLTPGDYRVAVNGVEGTFNLPDANSAAD